MTSASAQCRHSGARCHRPRSNASPMRDCRTTSSTPQHCARPPERHSSPADNITGYIWVASPRSQTRIRDTTPQFRSRQRQLRRCCECRDIRPRASENGTSPLHGNKARQGRSIVGQPGSASIGSTALSAPKLPSGSQPSMTKPHQFRITTVDPTTTSPKTLPTERSSGLNGSGRRLLTVLGSVISQPPPFTPRIMRQLNGSIGSPGNSMRAGMRCETPFTNVNSNSG